MRNAGVPPTDRRYVNLVKLLKAQNLSALQRKPTAPTETPSGKPNGVPQPPYDFVVFMLNMHLIALILFP
jgi:hypothetical protein